MNWETAKKQARDRDHGKCQRCGLHATDVHHRKPRQMGGTGNENVAFGLDNLVCLCRPCHDHIHRNPRESYAQGWLVHGWDDPANITFPAYPGLVRPPGACGIF